MDIYTYIQAVDYACSGKCSLDGACKGSRDDDYKNFWETNVYGSSIGAVTMLVPRANFWG